MASLPAFATSRESSSDSSSLFDRQISLGGFFQSSSSMFGSVDAMMLQKVLESQPDGGGASANDENATTSLTARLPQLHETANGDGDNDNDNDAMMWTSNTKTDSTTTTKTDFEAMIHRQLLPFGTSPPNQPSLGLAARTTTTDETPAAATTPVVTTVETDVRTMDAPVVQGPTVAMDTTTTTADTDVDNIFSSVNMMRDFAVILGREDPPPSDNDDDDEVPTEQLEQPYYFDRYTDQDVLCERGHRANNHPGNGWYLQAKERLQPNYLATQNKSYKTRIANELVQTVHSWGGRFIRFDKEQELWFAIDADAARRKASQALREDLTPEDREAKRKKYTKKRKLKAQQEQAPQEHP